MSNDWKPTSYPSVSPYLISPEAEELIGFIQEVFGGTLVRRFDHPDGSLKHAEVQIDDSLVMIGGAQTDITSATTHLHVYVEDANATFDRAVAAGAEVVLVPEQADRDDDFRGGVREPWSGTTWWMATQSSES